MAKIFTERNISKKDVITRNAASLFKAKGYSSSSMRELADMVGVEAPSLYNHIGSKRELLQNICFKVANEFTRQITVTKNGSGNVIDKLRTIIGFHIEMMLENMDEVYVANHEWKHLGEPYLSDFLSLRRNYEKSVLVLIEDGIEKKEIKSVNPYVAVLTILSAVRGLEFWQRNKKNIPAHELADNMIDHLFNGIVR